MLRVAVDFGTSSTCTAISVDGRPPQVVVVDGAPLIPSAVYVTPDGTLFVGHEAERQAAVDPSRYEPHPKRRIDEPELLLGDTVLPVVGVIRAVLRRALQEARHVAGGAPVDQLVLTHPADWGAARTQKLRRSAHGLAADLVLVPEPVAAAVFHAQESTPSRSQRNAPPPSPAHGQACSPVRGLVHGPLSSPAHGQASSPVHGLVHGPPSGPVHGLGPGQRRPAGAAPQGDRLAVLDLGGGTVDASVVRRDGPELAGWPAGYRVLAARGDPGFGGADIDQALLEHVGAQVAATDPEAWRRLVEGRDLADRRRRRVLLQDVRGAKETLSRHPYADVPMPPPFPDAHVTRDDLERLIAEPVGRTVELLASTVADAGLAPEQLAGVFLVGGSSRIPMVSRLVHERLGVLPVTLDQPETVVARGALYAVLAGVDRPAAVAGPFPPVPPRPPSAPYAQPHAGPAARTLAGPPRRPGRVAGAPPARRRSRRHWLVAAAVLVAAAAAAVLALTVPDRGPQQLADFHYRFTVPDGWRRSGGSQEARQVELSRADAPAGSERIFVRENELAYDAGADRGRAVDELRAGYEQRRAAGPPVAGFDPAASFAGRDVVHYSETIGADTVDWYVLFGGRYQVSVGCRHGEDSPTGVAVACDRVVRTLTVEEG